MYDPPRFLVAVSEACEGVPVRMEQVKVALSHEAACRWVSYRLTAAQPSCSVTARLRSDGTMGHFPLTNGNCLHVSVNFVDHGSYLRIPRLQ